jgi:hypothetical protein
VPTQLYWVALDTERRVCYPANTTDRQHQHALTYCYLSQSTASQNEKLTHCHRFGTLAHLSDRTAKSHPMLLFNLCEWPAVKEVSNVSSTTTCFKQPPISGPQGDRLRQIDDCVCFESVVDCKEKTRWFAACWCRRLACCGWDWRTTTCCTSALHATWRCGTSTTSSTSGVSLATRSGIRLKALNNFI